ncbi:hypothetical protein AX14_008963 [Amanita brunnescens Koide BX004]|nr:hypothetical protein AX14_008963 [Amanita brunnescens Koide BX004]
MPEPLGYHDSSQRHTIFALLEKWAEIYNVGSVKANEKRKKKWGRRQSSNGSLGGVLVHRRDSVHIGKIWDDFTMERQTVNEQVTGRIRAGQGRRNSEELARQVAELKLEKSREREEREKAIHERNEMERRLRKEQQDREWQLKREQEETERQRRKEQDERERRLREEQQLLKQQIADQQRQLQEQDRQWEMHLQQKEEETERRFQQMEEHIIRMSNSQIHLNLSPA